MKKYGILKWLVAVLLSVSCLVTVKITAFAADGESAGGREITIADGESVTVNVRNDEDMFELNGTLLIQQPEHKWYYRVPNQEQYWTYKVTWDAGTEEAAMSATLNRLHENMAIYVSENNADWQLIASQDQVRLGADYSVPNSISLNDGAFKLYYFELGRYFTEGNTLYIKFSAKDTSKDAGVSVVEDITFYDSWIKQRGTIDMSVNMTSVDPTDADYLWDDNDSTVATNSLGTHRFADATTYFEYKLVMPGDKAGEVYMKLFIMGTNGGISLSPDGVNYTLVRDASDSSERHGAEVVLADGYTCYYKLDGSIGTETVGGEVQKVVYVRFHSVDVSQGNGPDVYSLQFLNGAVRPQPENPGELFRENALTAEVSVLDDSIIYRSKNSSAGTYLGQWGRVAAGPESYFVYKIELPKTADTFSISVNSINSLVFTASTDDKNYKSFDALNMGADGNGAAITYNVTELLKSSKTIYLRFNGSQGQDSSLISLFIMYNDSSLTEKGKTYSEKTFRAFSAGDSTETEYWTNRANLNIVFNGNYREFNYDANGIYKFTYEAGAKAVKLFGEVGGTYVVSVSVDGIRWTDIKVSEQQYTTDYKWYTIIDSFEFDITKYVMTEENVSRNVYVKISDAITDNPFGAQLRGLGISSQTGDEVIGEKESGCSGNMLTGRLVLPVVLLSLSAACVATKNKKKY